MSHVRLFIGTYAPALHGGALPATTSAPLAPVSNPSFLAISADRSRLYAAAENPHGQLHAFAIGSTGTLLPISQTPSAGALPCHVALSPDGRLLGVANYLDGGVSIFSIRSDGGFAARVAQLRFEHASHVVVERQEAPHPHCVTWSPDGRILAIADLGADRVYLYDHVATDNTFRPREPQPWLELEPGDGPRHVVFSPDARLLYMLNELANTLVVTRLEAESSRFSVVASHSTLPAATNQTNTTAELALHPSGRSLYVSNRGHDSLAIFPRDPLSGLPGAPDFLQVGTTPRHFSFTPAGDQVLVAAQDANQVESYPLCSTTGRPLSATPVHRLSAPRPACVLAL